MFPYFVQMRRSEGFLHGSVSINIAFQGKKLGTVQKLSVLRHEK